MLYTIINRCFKIFEYCPTSWKIFIIVIVPSIPWIPYIMKTYSELLSWWRSLKRRQNDLIRASMLKRIRQACDRLDAMM